MKNYKIIGNKFSPTIDFNATTGNFFIKGCSIISNVSNFFSPILNWTKEYTASPAPKTILNIQLEYFLTSSAKFLYKLLKLFDQMYIAGHDIEVNWFYRNEDEDMKEYGEDFNVLLTMSINFKGVD